MTESPPSSKKSSRDPTRAIPRGRAQIWASYCSTPGLGSTSSLLTSSSRRICPRVGLSRRKGRTCAHGAVTSVAAPVYITALSIAALTAAPLP
jgi:hypothetical protein